MNVAFNRPGRRRDKREGRKLFWKQNFDLVNVSTETTAIETCLTSAGQHPGLCWECRQEQEWRLCSVVLSQHESKREVTGRSGEPAGSRAERLPLALASSFLIILWLAPPSGHAPMLENQNTK